VLRFVAMFLIFVHTEFHTLDSSGPISYGHQT